MSNTLITNWDEYIAECKRLPQDPMEFPPIHPSNPLEAHFFDVAEKHGIEYDLEEQLMGEDY